MNDKLKLISFPASYDAEDWCLMHSRCEDELKDIVLKSGNIHRFRANFRTRMDYLRQHRENAVQHQEWFEKLSYEDGLYSMHIAMVNNLRILYVFHDGKVWLLCAFAEKSRTKRDSYKRYISVAQERLKAILKEEA